VKVEISLMRTVESCPFRETSLSPNGDQTAVCGLLREITGLSGPGYCRVAADACRACCNSSVPSADRFNPVIASQVHRLASEVIQARGRPGCDLDQAIALRRSAQEKLQLEFPSDAIVSLPRRSRDRCFYLGQELESAGIRIADGNRSFACDHPDHLRTTVDRCHRCRDWTIEPRLAPAVLIELIPCREGRQGTPVRKWAVGVTTAPRAVPTVDWSLDSLIRAGWDSPRVFQDAPVPLSARSADLPATVRATAIGAWPNYYLGLIELLLREPDADAFLMVQDDALFYDRQDLRSYLEQVLWLSDPPGLVSLYCSAAYTRPVHGWHRLESRWVWGALAFIFPAQLARRFVSDPEVFDHRRGAPPGERAYIDTLIGNWAERHGVPIYFPTPSLVQHIGDASTLWGVEQAHGPRRADRFLGDLD
jgi:hypothetical protein